MSRIGIFGGTFDPIHFGHLRPALELRQSLGLEELRFLPCRMPPHRRAPGAPPPLRCEMVARAIAGVPGFVLDRRELDRSGPSYTIDTLREVRREMPTAQLVLLLGSDAFLGLPGWHDWERLFEFAHFAVTHRPGRRPGGGAPFTTLMTERLVEEPAQLWREASGRILFVEVTQLEISATAVRETVAAGGDIRYLVPEVVREFIEETGCYQQA
ncbi:MAG TPA: nicotinate-nucleotide adenylyltransferase [Gammaproteobacteria bacterium]|nr:nicotinate-nucleotide adenylyltransferase [Gammaproteobacteria bacterium]